MYQHGDPVAFQGMLCEIAGGPYVDRRIITSPITAGAFALPIIDLDAYALRHDTCPYLLFAREDDLRLIPSGDALARLVENATEPPARKETPE